SCVLSIRTVRQSKNETETYRHGRGRLLRLAGRRRERVGSQQPETIPGTPRWASGGLLVPAGPAHPDRSYTLFFGGAPAGVEGCFSEAFGVRIVSGFPSALLSGAELDSISDAHAVAHGLADGHAHFQSLGV